MNITYVDPTVWRNRIVIFLVIVAVCIRLIQDESIRTVLITAYCFFGVVAGLLAISVSFVIVYKGKKSSRAWEYMMAFILSGLSCILITMIGMSWSILLVSLQIAAGVCLFRNKGAM